MMTEDDLEGLFAAARHETPRPPAALATRVIAEAEALRQTARVAPKPQRRAPLWSGLSAVFGGGGALAGMLTATVAGFWIGFAQPDTLGLVSAALAGTGAEIDMMPGLDALLDETP